MLQEDIYLARMQDPLQEMVYFLARNFLANLANLYSCKMALILHVSCFSCMNLANTCKMVLPGYVCAIIFTLVTCSHL